MKTRNARPRNVKNLSRATKRQQKSLSPKRVGRTEGSCKKTHVYIQSDRRSRKHSVSYQEDPTAENEIELQVQKQSLHLAYNQCMEEELEEQMRRVETLEISGRNSSKKGILEGGSKEERVKIRTGFIIFSHCLVLRQWERRNKNCDRGFALSNWPIQHFWIRKSKI